MVYEKAVIVYKEDDVAYVLSFYQNTIENENTSCILFRILSHLVYNIVTFIMSVIILCEVDFFLIFLNEHITISPL